MRDAFVILFVVAVLFGRSVVAWTTVQFQAIERHGVSALVPPSLLPLSIRQPVDTATPTPKQPTEADVAARVAPSVVRVVAGSSSGSGVKVTGGILTNAHVVGGNDNPAYVTESGVRYTGKVIRRNSTLDLALLSDQSSLPTLVLEPARMQRPDDSVLVLGYPRSDVLSGPATLTRGLISAFRDDPQNSRLLVQTDAATNPGNSGGTMVNMRGKLVGIVTEQIADSQGLNFAIASESLQLFLDDRVPTPMPSPTPVLRYKSLDVRPYVIRLADLGPGWSEETLVSNSEMASYQFTAVTGTATNAHAIQINAVIELSGFVSRIISFDQYAAQERSSGRFAVRVAPIGDIAYASIADSGINRDVYVASHQSNVEAFVELRGYAGDDWVTPQVGASLLRKMINRLP